MTIAQMHAELLREPRPVEANDVRCDMEAPGWRLAWQLDGGRRQEKFGPVFLHLSQAHAAAVILREAHGLQ